VLFTPVKIVLPPGVYVSLSPNFVAPEVLSFKVETLDPVVTYNSANNTWVVADSWDFMETKTVQAVLLYRTQLDPNLPQKQQFAVIISPLTPEESAINRTSTINFKQDTRPLEFSLDKIDSRGFVTLNANRQLSRTWDWNETFIHFGLHLEVKPAQF